MTMEELVNEMHELNIEAQESLDRTDRFRRIGAEYDRKSEEMDKAYENNVSCVNEAEKEGSRRANRWGVLSLFSYVFFMGGFVASLYNENLRSSLRIMSMPGAVMGFLSLAMAGYYLRKTSTEYSKNRSSILDDHIEKKDELWKHYESLVDLNNKEYESRIKSYRDNRRVRKVFTN